MFNLETKKVILSRNVLWLDKNYAEYKGITKINNTQIVQALESDTEGEDVPEPKTDSEEEPKTEEEPQKEQVQEQEQVEAQPVAQIPRELKNLDTFYNPVIQQ